MKSLCPATTSYEAFTAMFALCVGAMLAGARLYSLTRGSAVAS